MHVLVVELFQRPQWMEEVPKMTINKYWTPSSRSYLAEDLLEMRGTVQEY